jgi:hypothetical protein
MLGQWHGCSCHLVSRYFFDFFQCINLLGSSNGTGDRSSLVLVVNTLAGEVLFLSVWYTKNSRCSTHGGTTLGSLEDDSVISRYQHGMMRPGSGGAYGDLASRAASRVATTVDDDVTLTVVVV